MNRKGFTLIELMVVVLIIGILSSIALPQYQKAIKKARATEAITVGKKILEAEEVYFLENQEYTSDLSKLRIRIPTMKNWSIDPTAGVVANNTNTPPSVSIGLGGAGNLNGVMFIFMGNPTEKGVMCVSSDQTICKNILPCSANEQEQSTTIFGATRFCPL